MYSTIKEITKHWNFHTPCHIYMCLYCHSVAYRVSKYDKTSNVKESILCHIRRIILFHYLVSSFNDIALESRITHRHSNQFNSKDASWANIARSISVRCIVDFRWLEPLRDLLRKRLSFRKYFLLSLSYSLSYRHFRILRTTKLRKSYKKLSQMYFWF